MAGWARPRRSCRRRLRWRPRRRQPVPTLQYPTSRCSLLLLGACLPPHDEDSALFFLLLLSTSMLIMLIPPTHRRTQKHRSIPHSPLLTTAQQLAALHVLHNGFCVAPAHLSARTYPVVMVPAFGALSCCMSTNYAYRHTPRSLRPSPSCLLTYPQTPPTPPNSPTQCRHPGAATVPRRLPRHPPRRRRFWRRRRTAAAPAAARGTADRAHGRDPPQMRRRASYGGLYVCTGAHITNLLSDVKHNIFDSIIQGAGLAWAMRELQRLVKSGVAWRCVRV